MPSTLLWTHDDITLVFVSGKFLGVEHPHHPHHPRERGEQPDQQVEQVPDTAADLAAQETGGQTLHKSWPAVTSESRLCRGSSQVISPASPQVSREAAVAAAAEVPGARHSQALRCKVQHWAPGWEDREDREDREDLEVWEDRKGWEDWEVTGRTVRLP